MTHKPSSPSRTTRPIEIFAPDRNATELLLLYAAPLFPAEIAAGSVWIVRLQVPGGGGSMLTLLSLVQRWLESARLPWANVRDDGDTFLIRPSTEFAQFAAAASDTHGGRPGATAGESVYAWS